MVKLLKYIIQCIAYALGFGILIIGGLISLLLWDVRHVEATVKMLDQTWEDLLWKKEYLFVDSTQLLLQLVTFFV